MNPSNEKCVNCNIYLRKTIGVRKTIMTIDEANIATEKIGKKSMLMIFSVVNVELF